MKCLLSSGSVRWLEITVVLSCHIKDPEHTLTSSQAFILLMYGYFVRQRYSNYYHETTSLGNKRDGLNTEQNNIPTSSSRSNDKAPYLTVLPRASQYKGCRHVLER